MSMNVMTGIFAGIEEYALILMDTQFANVEMDIRVFPAREVSQISVSTKENSGYRHRQIFIIS